jgi:hypothetical protein
MKGKGFLIYLLALVMSVVVLEVVSIQRWTASTSLNKRVGVIDYRDLGSINYFTMGMNEIMLGIMGFDFSGPKVHGTFGKWMHTYSRDVSE